MSKNLVENKTVLVTGATDGIGLETARQLAMKGAHVLLHGRNRKKVETAAERVQQSAPGCEVTIYLADFASLADVKRMAENIASEDDQLHVLINNAGNFYHDRQLTTDGLEMTFVVNHLAPMLLTLLLQELIIKSRPARIVNVSSSSHKATKEIDFTNLQWEQGYDPFKAYALSKLGNVIFSVALAERLKDKGVTVNALNPGVVATKLLRNSYDLEGVSVEEGARTPVYLANSPDVAGISGKYFQDEAEWRMSALATETDVIERFMRISEDLISGYLK